MVEALALSDSSIIFVATGSREASGARVRAQVGDEQHRLGEARALESSVGMETTQLAIGIDDGHRDLAGAPPSPVERSCNSLLTGKGRRKRREYAQLRCLGRRLRAPGGVAQMDKVGVATGRKSGVDDDALGRASRAWRGQPQCLDPFAVLREDDEGRRPRIVNGADDAIAQLGLCATVHLCRREGGGVRGRGRR